MIGKGRIRRLEQSLTVHYPKCLINLWDRDDVALIYNNLNLPEKNYIILEPTEPGWGVTYKSLQAKSSFGTVLIYFDDVAPTTTLAPTTTNAPTTTAAPGGTTTTAAPTTTVNGTTTTVAPTTTLPPTTTLAPTTTLPPGNGETTTTLPPSTLWATFNGTQNTLGLRYTGDTITQFEFQSVGLATYSESVPRIAHLSNNTVVVSLKEIYGNA